MDIPTSELTGSKRERYYEMLDKYRKDQLDEANSYAASSHLDSRNCEAEAKIAEAIMRDMRAQDRDNKRGGG